MLGAEHWRVALGVVSMLMITGVQHARAMNLYTGVVNGQSLEINLDTTVEYSNIFRVNSPSKVLTSNLNGNDGDLNFQHGLVDNTFDVLPIFDLRYGNYGVHVSGEAYLDTSYLGRTQNDSPGTYNPISANYRHFTSATRNVNGQNAVLLDAYAYGTKYFGVDGEQALTVKVGRQTLMWGQSLFFANNGIAAGQAPIDVIKALNLPNAQAQQIFLPVGQAVVTYAPNSNLSFQAYYQFEWEPDTLEGVGSYFSTTDILDKGGQRLLFAPYYGVPRVKDLRPPINNGQFGFSIQGAVGSWDMGLYALRYDDHAPGGIYLSKSYSDYWVVYPRDIQVYGSSFNTVYDGVSIAGEISGRRNMPLVSAGAPVSAYPGNSNGGALYPVGSTVAAQASEIWVTPSLPFDRAGVTVLSEFALNHVVSVDKNRNMLRPDRNATAGAFQFEVIPTYDDVLPNLNLQFPIGFKYNLFGRSQVDSTMNHGTGFFNIGVSAHYRTTWTASLTYQDYLGGPNQNLNPLADRGYIAFSIQNAF
ncbi:hypothetical protein GCM10010909_07580 [Acidocella aquatica]|uniref:DUF1302 domain-containing protein n=1 Tax=Acidocella aquatica TaxID=1922313 RepID=A0ABQ6A7N9_9PROT|nr:DUF1302 family protein [Acidocella aquatica]GLR66080.1 hypothetical protein GCM10010909_07580 [Acidocella aquatica]